MELNIVELIVQAGALGLTVLLVVGVWKVGQPFIARLFDALEAQQRNNEASVKVQAEVASNLEQLCDRLGDCENRMMVEAKASADVLKNLTTQLRAHENRAQKRHEQAMEHADQRHAEMIGVLKHLNGKT